MNHLTIQAGAKQIDAPDSYEKFYTTWHRDPHGLYVTANRTAAGHGADNYTGDGPPLFVTVYVEDGEKGRVELGSGTFAIDVINGYDGENISGSLNNEFQLPTVDVDPAKLSSLRPGVYVLKADAAANKFNDATTSEIGELTVVGVSKVTVEPASLSVEKGETQQQKFTATVYVVESDQDKVDKKTVTWSVSGQKSRNTKIDPQTGLLTVGEDEKAGTITVTAESDFDNYGQGKTKGKAQVTVTEPDHSVTNDTPEVQPGQDGHWEFAGKFANLSRLSLNGTDFTIVPKSETKAQLKYPGYSGVAGIAEEGSVKVTLNKEFLATLPAGKYKLEAFFDDGGVQNVGSTQFTVIGEETQPTATTTTATTAPTATTGPTVTAAPTTTTAPAVATAAPTPTAPTGAPQTGDETNIWPWVILVVAAGAAILAVVIYRRKRHTK